MPVFPAAKKVFRSETGLEEATQILKAHLTWDVVCGM